MSTTVAIPAHHKPAVPEMVRRAAEAAQAAFDATQMPAEGLQDPDPSGGPSPSPAEPAAPSPEPAPPHAETPAPPATTPADQVNWEHRYQSLKGKHDAEMARLSAEVSNLHRVLAAVQAAPQSAPGPGAAAPPTLPPDLQFKPITDEERSDYGEEFLSVAERAAAQRFAPVIAGLQAEIEKLKGNITGVQTFVQQDARRVALDYLASQVPDWQEMDSDPGFIAWLQQLDPFAGVRRQDLLDNANQTNNGPRIVAFFKAYKDMQAPAPAAPNPPASPAPRGRTSLETFAAPGRGRPGTPSGTPAGAGEAPVVKQSEISQFYERVRRGVYRDDPAEKARLEAAIFAATSAGRVIPG